MPRRLLCHLIAATALLVLSIWLSTGTLAPYAATFEEPDVSEPCRYLLNIDHEVFHASFLMLSGEPRETWEDSVILRRILFPLIAFPAMKAFGFYYGGIATSIGLNLGSFLLFVLFIRRRIGDRAAIAAMWLLSTYPGIAYWVGLPYSYAIIVPASLLAAILLDRLAGAEGIGEVALVSLGLGVLFTGYDLLPFFAPAAIMLLALRKRLFPIIISGAALLFPSLAVSSALDVLARVPPLNSNSLSYWIIIESYLGGPALKPWLKELTNLPATTLSTFFYSNFVVLPALFIIVILLRLLDRPLRPNRLEGAILLSSAAVFLFLNGAPPYEARWQLRGAWIARLFQPVFVAFILYVARAFEEARRTRAVQGVFIALAVLLNGAVIIGPLLHQQLAATVYQRFYRHSPPESMLHNLDRYGRRPLGFCDPVLTIKPTDR